MEIRKSISSVAICISLFLCALLSFSLRAQTLSYTYFNDFPSDFSPLRTQEAEVYSFSLLDQALSNSDFKLISASNKEKEAPLVLLNVLRTAKNEQDYYWVSPLFAFDCNDELSCTPNAGSQPSPVALTYIAMKKNGVAPKIVDRLGELVGRYKVSEAFKLLVKPLKMSFEDEYPSVLERYGIISLAGGLIANASDLWVIADVVPLFVERAERGGLKGIAADLVKDILEDIALSQPILSAPWERIAKESMAKSNVLVFSIIRTDERDNLFHWITPISKNLHGLYGIDEPYFDSFDDVPVTYRVGALLEDYRYEVALDKGFKVKAYGSWGELVDALMRNDVDLVFGSRGAVNFGCNPKRHKCETITLTSKYNISTAYLALSKKDTCVLVLEKLKLAAAGVKMSNKFNEQLSSWSDMVSQEYGIAHHTEHGVVHLWNPN